tara:strand:- start:389 stop:772 length:384 start_codon:yes stop_codon:yes gene_type:complete
MEITPEMIVTVAGMSASVIASFAIVRTKVQQLEEQIDDLQSRQQQLDGRLDKNDTATDLVEQRVNVISGMMDPQSREKLHRNLERLEANSEHLRRDVNTLMNMHNGKHPDYWNHKGELHGSSKSDNG